jgi:hypothetical protein
MGDSDGMENNTRSACIPEQTGCCSSDLTPTESPVVSSRYVIVLSWRIARIRACVKAPPSDDSYASSSCRHAAKSTYGVAEPEKKPLYCGDGLSGPWEICEDSTGDVSERCPTLPRGTKEEKDESKMNV